MAAAVPTLTTKGWLTEPNEKAEQLMAWFMVAEHTQSKTFFGNISSFSELVVRHGKSPLAMTENTKIQLESYLGRYFDYVEVEVRDFPLPGESEFNGRFMISIRVTATQDGARINLLEKAEINNSVFKRVVEELNNGQS